MTLKPGLRYGSLKVIGTDTDRFLAYDCLLRFHCNHGPISYRFRDIKFSHPFYFALMGFPLELGTDDGDKKLE